MNMKKKIIIISIAVALVVILLSSLISVQQFQHGSASFGRDPYPVDFREMTFDVYRRNRAVLLYVDNHSSLEELITSSITMAEFWMQPGFEMWEEIGVLVEIQAEERTRRAELYEIYALFDVQAIRRLDDGDVYAVLKIERRGFLYLFFPYDLGYQLSHMAFDYELYPGKRIILPAGTILNSRALEHDEVFDFTVLPQDFPREND